ncbi:hypothetical protein U9M48_040926 [Paspalum notatum var. saurae]|uniref:Uncharacterized protein n=1 Tax=Paspalum notatum var. saurae TaxID=547442 RepID=A0AAQ3XEA4_PASNO
MIRNLDWRHRRAQSFQPSIFINCWGLRIPCAQLSPCSAPSPLLFVSPPDIPLPHPLPPPLSPILRPQSLLSTRSAKLISGGSVKDQCGSAAEGGGFGGGEEGMGERQGPFEVVGSTDLRLNQPGHKTSCNSQDRYSMREMKMRDRGLADPYMQNKLKENKCTNGEGEVLLEQS